MGALCMWFNPAAAPPSPPRFLSPSPPFPARPHAAAGAGASPRGGSCGGAVGFAVYASGSNPRILKSSPGFPYRRRYGASPYQEHEGEDEEDGEEGDEESDEEYSDDEYSDVVEFHGDQHSGVKQLSVYSRTQPSGKSVQERLLRKDQTEWPSMNRGSLRTASSSKDGQYEQAKGLCHATNGPNESSYMDVGGGKELNNGKSAESMFLWLKDELDFDVRWFPLINYLSTYGLKESHFVSIYERHMPCFQISIASAKQRLEYLMSVGVKHGDIRKMLLRQPQILEYSVENNLKAHVNFLASLGVPDSRIRQIITVAPSLFSYSIDDSLKPTIRYLVEEVGISRTDVSKVVQLSPQILVQRIDNSWNSRLRFLSKELGAPRDSIVKMVRKHPQLLHYSIEDGMQPRIDFLRSIGMRNSEVLKVLTSLTQVLSLSLEGNLKPKYLYLVKELRNEVRSLTKYPVYLSLSLEQRIRPRHRFLVSLKKAPKGPFPLSSLVPTDECFCQRWAGTSLEKYLAFRQSLLLNNFAKKYARK